MTEASAPAPPEPIWPDAIFRLIEQRDRARGVAVALEQENAVLRDAIGLELESPRWRDVPSVLDFALAMTSDYEDQPEPEEH